MNKNTQQTILKTTYMLVLATVFLTSTIQADPLTAVIVLWLLYMLTAGLRNSLFGDNGVQ